MLMMKPKGLCPRRRFPRRRTGLRGAFARMWRCFEGPEGRPRRSTVKSSSLYQDRLYNAVLRLVGDREEARELTQEAFTRGLMKLDSFRGDASPVHVAVSHRGESGDQPASEGAAAPGLLAGPPRRERAAAGMMTTRPPSLADRVSSEPSAAVRRRQRAWSGASGTRRCWPRWAGSTPSIAPCW